MSKTNKVLYNIRMLEKIAQKQTVIHKINPNIKVILTLIFIVVTISYDKKDLSGLLPLCLYPVLLIVIGEIPLKPIFSRIGLVLPLIIGVGILNPIFSEDGWLIFFSLIIKSILTVSSTLVLVATTSMAQLGHSLRFFKVPKILVLQLMLTYRYISLLIEELSRMLRAYSLRAPNRKGISLKESGTFVGHLLIRTIDRADRIYVSMRLRGFEGEYVDGSQLGIQKNDLLLLFGGVTYFAIVRIVNVPVVIGSIILEVL